MRGDMKCFAMVCAAFAILSGIIGGGDLGHIIIGISAALFIGAPLALFLTLWLLHGLLRSGSTPAKWPRFAAFCLIAATSLMFSLAIGAVLNRWGMHETRSYVARCVPLLDDYREKNGRYPASLEKVDAPAPLFLPKGFTYSSDTDNYRFEIWDSARMMSGYDFNSSRRVWIPFD
jgi:hypothetical protein